jgi:NADPH:quinone reductase-like Zn-dependent oxidoreductase
MPTYTALTTLPEKAHAEALAEALEHLEPEPTGIGSFEMEDGSGLWEIGAYFEAAPDTLALALLAKVHGAKPFVISELPEVDWVAKVRELTGGRGVDVVMDAVGRDTFEGSLDCLRPLGFMISFGNASGPVPPFDIGLLGKKGSLKITRPTLFTHIADHATCQQMARELFAKVLSGDVKIRIDQRFALDQVADAHRALEARETTGQTVILP